jgi:hypothetical protein
MTLGLASEAWVKGHGGAATKGVESPPDFFADTVKNAFEAPQVCEDSSV